MTLNPEADTSKQDVLQVLPPKTNASLIGDECVLIFALRDGGDGGIPYIQDIVKDAIDRADVESMFSVSYTGVAFYSDIIEENLENDLVLGDAISIPTALVLRLTCSHLV